MPCKPDCMGKRKEKQLTELECVTVHARQRGITIIDLDLWWDAAVVDLVIFSDPRGRKHERFVYRQRHKSNDIV